jgi:P2 family phage major capsid protein
VLNKGGAGGAIIVGTAAGSDYTNLDALVYDGVELLDPWAQEDVEMVAIVGRKLLHDKYFPLINADPVNNSTQVLASDIIVSQKRIGGLPAVRVPYFPDNAVLITRYDNLSLYWQEGGRRRLVKDCPELDQINNFESSNDAYVVEDYGFAALIENIQLPAGQPTLGDVDGAAAFAAEQAQVAPAVGD